jgi:threonine dehydratase
VIELLEDAPGPDLVLCPVGGGGLLAGTAVAAKALRPVSSVIAAEPAGAADAASRSRPGHIIPLEQAAPSPTACAPRSARQNFAIIRRHVDDVVIVSEEAIVAAMRRLWETMKIVVEPSGAVPYAAMLEGKVNVAGRRVGSSCRAATSTSTRCRGW